MNANLALRIGKLNKVKLQRGQKKKGFRESGFRERDFGYQLRNENFVCFFASGKSDVYG